MQLEKDVILKVVSATWNETEGSLALEKTPGWPWLILRVERGVRNFWQGN
jgi:hypothetical protein